MANSKLFKLFVVIALLVSPILSEVRIGMELVNDQLKSMQEEIQKTIQQGKKNIWDEIQKDQPLWNLPPWLGTFFLSQYYFELKAYNITSDLKFNSKFDPLHLRDKLIREQHEDGSWMQLVDLNRKEGSLDATIFNYWFLKDVGVGLQTGTMKKAKKFILDHGGIENAQVMTKFKLAAFGLYEWVLLPYIPLQMFYNGFPFYSYIYIKEYVGQWVYPHLVGLAYMRYHKTVFPVSRVCLQELRTSRSDQCQVYKAAHPGISGFTEASNDTWVDNLMEEMISLKGRRGSYGAYTISTLLVLLSFKDYSLRYEEHSDFKAYYQNNVQTSLEFVEELYFNRRVPYEGSLDDGRYWDSILAAFALLEAGQSPEKLTPTITHLIQAVVDNGGIPYGIQFQYAPDIDDTGMLLMLYGKMKNLNPNTYSQQIQRSYNWIKSKQNEDGGFPAFDKDKNDNQYEIIKMIFKWTRIDRSSEIFDPSCPDIVGHVLEGMGECGIVDKEVIGHSVKYLLKSQKNHMWSARWGINYIYGIGAVFPGLARIGYDMNQEWIINATTTLQSLQQEDGGFGEDSESYNTDSYLKGVTTVSMTAWGLLAYLEVAHLNIPNIQNSIQKATQYILNNFKANNNRFYDRSVVGTGHRGVLNLQYPVYAFSFPLVALARLNNLLDGKKQPFINRELTEEIHKIIKEASSSDL